MFNIEENAFQIARYLLDNPEIEQTEIRNALELSDTDFQIALKYLVDTKYCDPAGKFGTGIIWKKDLARLQDFVNCIDKERVSLSLDAERLLKFLFANQSDFPFSICNHIMTKFNWEEDRYLQVAQELGDKGFVRGEYAAGNRFFKILLESQGRETVRNNFRNLTSSRSAVTIEKLINIGNNNIVNVDSTLTSVNQSVQANSYISPTAKQELESLLKQLIDSLKDVPAENRDDAEAVAEMAKSLIENATKEKPNKPLVKISADGLKQAAENIAVIVPKVLLIAQAIISFVMTLSQSHLIQK
jgi:hypothetical protein